MSEPYIHTKLIHNEQSPGEMVPLLMELFNPKSVVDLGCGTGTFLKEFKTNGVATVLGYDGPWVNKTLLRENLLDSEVVICDLEDSLTVGAKFDLAVCLEVAEHLSPTSADRLVSDLVQMSDVIVFSAAIPGQGGQNHVNEQWLGYWQEKFENKGYVIDDVLRPIFWENDKIEYWYRQNIVVIRKLDYSYCVPKIQNVLKDPIHKSLFAERTQKYLDFKNGNETPKLYLKLFLKSILKLIK